MEDRWEANSIREIAATPEKPNTAERRQRGGRDGADEAIECGEVEVGGNGTLLEEKLHKKERGGNSRSRGRCRKNMVIQRRV